MRASLLGLLLVLPLTALAVEKPLIKYKPPAADDDERPLATGITVGAQGSDFALRVEFSRSPWGEECKNRCANVTIFVDTDDNPSTGLQLGKGVPETGADLAIVIQGAHEYKESSSEVLLRVKARQLPDGTTAADSGDSLAELDNRRDPDRVQSDGKTVYALIDGTTTSIPSGKMMRVIYHPPGAKALTGKTKGMLAGGSGKVEIFRKGKTSPTPRPK